MSQDWKNDLFGCDDPEACKLNMYNHSIVKILKTNSDSGLCAYCIPCYLNYRNAENLGKSGLLCTLLFCFATPCLPIFLLRHEARDKYNIEVSIVNFKFRENFVNL